MGITRNMITNIYKITKPQNAPIDYDTSLHISYHSFSSKDPPTSTQRVACRHGFLVHLNFDVCPKNFCYFSPSIIPNQLPPVKLAKFCDKNYQFHTTPTLKLDH